MQNLNSPHAVPSTSNANQTVPPAPDLTTSENWFTSRGLLSFTEVMQIQHPDNPQPLSAPPQPNSGRHAQAELFRTMHFDDNQTDDAAMLWRLVRSGAIPDPPPGYAWRYDHLALETWLTNMLISQLNTLLGMEKVLRTESARLLRGNNHPSNMAALVAWAKHAQRKKIHFYTFPDWIARLNKFDLSKDLEIVDLLRLVSETDRRIQVTDAGKGKEVKMKWRYKVLYKADVVHGEEIVPYTTKMRKRGKAQGDGVREQQYGASDAGQSGWAMEPTHLPPRGEVSVLRDDGPLGVMSEPVSRAPGFLRDVTNGPSSERSLGHFVQHSIDPALHNGMYEQPTMLSMPPTRRILSLDPQDVDSSKIPRTETSSLTGNFTGPSRPVNVTLSPAFMPHLPAYTPQLPPASDYLNLLKLYVVPKENISELAMHAPDLPPDPTAPALALWLQSQLPPSTPLVLLPPLFRHLPSPAKDDLSLYARCIRFAQSISQLDLDWRAHPPHVNAMVARTNAYGVELLRSRTNIFIPPSGMNEGVRQLREFHAVLAMRFAKKFPQREYTAAWMTRIVGRILGEGNALAVLGLLAEEDKGRFVGFVRVYEERVGVDGGAGGCGVGIH